MEQTDTEQAHVEPGDTEHSHPQHEHPKELEYIKIAVILAVVTAAEVGVYYIPSLRPLIVPILLVMAVVKFILVAAWFMHLKFDSRLFRRLFMVGIVLALGVFTIVLVTMATGDGGGVTG